MPCRQHGLIHPEIDDDSREWWDRLRDERLSVARCSSCGHRFFPPAPTCPSCGREACDLEDVSGRGSVYSWVTVHRALDPVFGDDVPYTVLAVDLDEGPRIFGRLCGNASPEAGQRVLAVIYAVEGQPLVGFGPDPRS